MAERKRPVRGTKPAPGDRVTCKVPIHAYYSGYAGRPVVVFQPGMVGVVACETAKVRVVPGPGCDGRHTFFCVDFPYGPGGNEERVGLDLCNIVLLPR